MCEYLGYKVNFLQRTRIMNVDLGRLKLGSWRHLTAPEMEQINKMIANSSNTKEASQDKNKFKKRSFSNPKRDTKKPTSNTRSRFGKNSPKSSTGKPRSNKKRR